MLAEEYEKQLRFKPQQARDSSLVFQSQGSAGNNPEALARVLAVHSLISNIFGWQGKTDEKGKVIEQPKPLNNLIGFLTQYQASVNGKYHKDYVEIEIAKEIERKQSERKGVSIFNRDK